MHQRRKEGRRSEALAATPDAKRTGIDVFVFNFWLRVAQKETQLAG
jgi:hypothetical protein